MRMTVNSISSMMHPITWPIVWHVSIINLVNPVNPVNKAFHPTPTCTHKKRRTRLNGRNVSPF